MPILTANGANLYYEIAGKGQPIVLISGYCADHQAWMMLLPGLSQHYQVITLDNRGIGRTVDNGGELSIDLMAQDVLTLIDHLNLNKPHIIGHSMGGNIAQRIAHMAPDKISDVVLLTSAARWRLATGHAFRASLTMRENNISFDTIFDVMLPWLVGNTFLTNPKNAELLKTSILENPYPQSLVDQQRQFLALDKFDGNAYLKDIRARTLVIYGVEDIISLPYESAHLANAIPHATMLGLSCAHMANFEAPKEIEEKVLAFFNHP